MFTVHTGVWSLSISSLKTECDVFPEETNLKTLKFGNKVNSSVNLRNLFMMYILKVPVQKTPKLMFHEMF